MKGSSSICFGQVLLKSPYKEMYAKKPIQATSAFLDCRARFLAFSGFGAEAFLGSGLGFKGYRV